MEGTPPRPRQEGSLSISTQKAVECAPAQPESLSGAFDNRVTEPELFCERANDRVPLESGAPICRRSHLPRPPFCT
jgi:hypothetical protein